MKKIVSLLLMLCIPFQFAMADHHDGDKASEKVTADYFPLKEGDNQVIYKFEKVIEKTEAGRYRRAEG